MSTRSGSSSARGSAKMWIVWKGDVPYERHTVESIAIQRMDALAREERKLYWSFKPGTVWQVAREGDIPTVGTAQQRQ